MLLADCGWCLAFRSSQLRSVPFLQWDRRPTSYRPLLPDEIHIYAWSSHISISLSKEDHRILALGSKLKYIHLTYIHRSLSSSYMYIYKYARSVGRQYNNHIWLLHLVLSIGIGWSAHACTYGCGCHCLDWWMQCNASTQLIDPSG